MSNKILQILDKNLIIKDIFMTKADLDAAAKEVGFYKVVADETNDNTPAEYYWDGTKENKITCSKEIDDKFNSMIANYYTKTEIDDIMPVKMQIEW